VRSLRKPIGCAPSTPERWEGLGRLTTARDRLPYHIARMGIPAMSPSAIWVSTPHPDHPVPTDPAGDFGALLRADRGVSWKRMTSTGYDVPVRRHHSAVWAIPVRQSTLGRQWLRQGSADA
jgi:hypothetical protein